MAAAVGSPGSPFSFASGSPFASPRSAFSNPSPTHPATTSWCAQNSLASPIQPPKLAKSPSVLEKFAERAAAIQARRSIAAKTPDSSSETNRQIKIVGSYRDSDGRLRFDLARRSSGASQEGAAAAAEAAAATHNGTGAASASESGAVAAEADAAAGAAAAAVVPATPSPAPKPPAAIVPATPSSPLPAAGEEAPAAAASAADRSSTSAEEAAKVDAVISGLAATSVRDDDAAATSSSSSSSSAAPVDVADGDVAAADAAADVATVVATDAAADEGGVAVGARVMTEFGEGIVRFQGAIESKEGVWVGVELDEPNGANDGVAKGVRYFSCAAKHGLFARPAKVAPLSTSSMSSASSSSTSSASASFLAPAAAPAAASKRRAAAAPPLIHASSTNGSLSYYGGAVKRSYDASATNQSQWPERHVPKGWREFWAPVDALDEDGSPHKGAPKDADAIDDAIALPIAVYVSSTTGDRRAAKNCRWVVDFMVNKKVPHSVVDLSVFPHMRAKLLERLGGDGGGGDGGDGDMGAAADGDDSVREAFVPAVDIAGEQILSIGELQDLEDHGELDPVIEAVLRSFADADLTI